MATGNLKTGKKSHLQINNLVKIQSLHKALQKCNPVSESLLIRLYLRIGINLN